VVVGEDGKRVPLLAGGACDLAVRTCERMRVQLREGLLVAAVVAGDLLFRLFWGRVLLGGPSGFFLSFSGFAGFL
jgi:hypothetical protein